MLSKQLLQKWKEEYSKEWFQFILDNPEYDWKYYLLSRNPNITWEIVKNNPDKNWDYNWVSENSNITIDIVKNNPQINWSYYHLSINPMTQGFNDYMEKKEELYNIAYKIIDRYTNRDIAEMIMSI